MKIVTAAVTAAVLAFSTGALAKAPSIGEVDECLRQAHNQLKLANADVKLISSASYTMPNEHQVVLLDTEIAGLSRQLNARLYCSIDKDGTVSRLNSNPRLFFTH